MADNDKLPLSVIDAAFDYDPSTHTLGRLPSVRPSIATGANPPGAPAPLGQYGAPIRGGLPSMSESAASADLPMTPFTGMGSSISSGANPPAAKPSFWQKLGHGLATAGNIAGDVLIPNVMTNIPGTERHKEFEEAGKLRGEEERARMGLEQAQTAEAQGRAWNVMHPGAEETAKSQAQFNFADQAMRNAGYQPGSPEYNQRVLGVQPQSLDERVVQQKLAQGEPPWDIYNEMAAAKLQAQPGNRPIGAGGVTQAGTQLQQLTAQMPADRAGDFQKAFAPLPTDTEAQAAKKYSDAKEAAQLYQSGKLADEQRADREVQNRIADTMRQIQLQESQEKHGEEPVYGIDQNGQTVQTTRGDAQDRGLKNVVKVTGEQIDKDKLTVRDLNDIQLNLSNYRNAIARQGHLSTADQQAESEVLNEGGMKLGAFGVTIPTDWLNRLYNAKAWNKLRPEQQQAVVAYYRAREMTPAYQRVLTNSGRSSEQAMNMALQNIPAPIMDEGSANKMLDGWQDNVDQVSQGQPKFPGIDSQSEVKKRVETQWRGPAQAERQEGAFRVPAGAPSAAKVPDGKVLKDQAGKIIARARGG